MACISVCEGGTSKTSSDGGVTVNPCRRRHAAVSTPNLACADWLVDDSVVPSTGFEAATTSTMGGVALHRSPRRRLVRPLRGPVWSFVASLALVGSTIRRMGALCALGSATSETVSGSAEPVCLHERNNSSVISRLMSVDLCPTGLSGPPPAGTERLRHCSCSCDNLNFSKFFRRHDVNVRSSSAVQAKTSANLDCCPRAIFP